MHTCRRCQQEINPEQIPFVIGICWQCHTPADRQHIKERFRESPSIVENAMCSYFEAYEEREGMLFINETPILNEVDFQKAAGTTGRNFWDKSTLTPATEKPSEREVRRPAPGLEKKP